MRPTVANLHALLLEGYNAGMVVARDEGDRRVLARLRELHESSEPRETPGPSDPDLAPLSDEDFIERWDELYERLELFLAALSRGMFVASNPSQENILSRLEPAREVVAGND